MAETQPQTPTKPSAPKQTKEEFLAELKVKDPESYRDALLEEIEDLKKAKEIEALEKELAALRGPVKREATSGDFTSSKRHYRFGRMYEPGEVITIVDEVPGKDWVRVPPKKK